MTVALAIGVNAGTFSVVKTALYTSLGVPEPDRLAYYSIGNGVHATPLSGPLYEALRHSSSFGELAIWDSSVNLFLQTSDGASRLNGGLVNGEFFSVMRIVPFRGRFFDSGDDQPGGGENGWTAVLSYNFWQVRFGADPNIIGKVAIINGMPVHVVGILPKSFTGLNPPAATEVLLPRHFLDVLNPGQDRFSKNWYMEWDVYGRIPMGTTLEKLQAALKTADRQLREAADPSGQMFTEENFPRTGNGLLSVGSGQLGHSYRLQAVRQPLLAMLVLAFVLFLFCVCNLVLLLIGRGVRTAQQTLIRVAFGATYRHILVTAALEGLILVLMGSAAGVPLAWIVSRALSALMRSSDGFESFPMVNPSFPLLMLGAVVMLLVAAIVTTRTAFWHAKRKDRAILNTATRMVTARSNPWIVGGEMVAATFFLTLTVVGVAVFGHLFHQASGFDTSSVVASLGLINSGGTPKTLVPERLDRIVQIIRESPGVLSVATTNLLPLSGAYARTTFAARLNGGVVRKQDGMWPAAVSTEYFAATGTRILRGRSFVSDDRSADPVCVMSVSAAEALFGSESVLGKYIYANENDARENSPKPHCRVIGVAEDAHLKSMTEPPSQAVYILSNEPSPNIIVRAAAPTLAVQAIRNAVQVVAPLSLDSEIDSLQIRIDDDTRFLRALTFFDASCTGFAVLMMAIGLFGVISLEVASHRREIGVQMAMGARSLNVSKAVLKGFFKPIFIGVVIGSALTWIAVTRLREIAPIGTVTAVDAYLIGCLLVLLVMSGAVSAPIRRALRISPAECLRSE